MDMSVLVKGNFRGEGIKNRFKTVGGVLDPPKQ